MSLLAPKRRFTGVLTILALGCFILLSFTDVQDILWPPDFTCNGECEGMPFIINTPSCIIPDFHLDQPGLAQYRIRTTQPLELICSQREPLTEVRGMYLYVFEERLSSYGTSKDSVMCYYEGVRRVQQRPDDYDMACDNQYILKERVDITSYLTPIAEDIIVVTCRDIRRGSEVYKDVHYFLQPRRIKEKHSKYKNRKDTLNKRGGKNKKLNVLIMGLDSVSRGNMRRHLPKTFDFLKNHLHAIDLKGFNKIGDNTNPNMMAMLAGLSHKDMEEIQKPNLWAEVKFDDYPFLWKNFSAKGYVTLYAEDAPDLGTFNYHKYGFVEEPTDYYTRPYFLAAEELIGHYGNGLPSSYKSCLGSKMTLKMMHEISLNIPKVMKDLPYFSHFWSSSLTHDYLDLAALADQPSVQYLKKMERSGNLEDTILFFISDHGLRFGDFRKTYAGLVEERMPYVMVLLPKWFKKTYPNAYNNMLTNSERLTSPYDLHVTLIDILHENYRNTEESKALTKYGQSLFTEIPLNRTCEDASIPEKYCACQRTEEADTDDDSVVKAAQATIETLNDGLESFPNCSILSLDKVISGRVGSPGREINPRWKGSLVNSYIVTFVTSPGGGIMEAHLQELNGEYYLTSDVSRINKYGNQSHCIRDLMYEKYCYCKDLLPSNKQTPPRE